MCSKKTKKSEDWNVYFDETNHTGNIGLSNKNNTKLSYEISDEWYNFIFISFVNDKYMEEQVLMLEKKYFPDSPGEIKGSRLTKKDLFKIPENNLKFYIDLTKEILKQKRAFQFGSLNKIEWIIRYKLFNEKSFIYNLIYIYEEGAYNMFIGAITKYIVDQIPLPFFTFVSQNKNKKDIANFLINKLEESCAKLEPKNITAPLIDKFQGYIEFLYFFINSINPIREVGDDFNKWEYRILSQSIEELSKEMQFNPKIFGDHPKTIESLREKYCANIINSKDSALSRVPDYLLSIFRRIVKSVDEKHSKKRQFSEDYVAKTPYDEKLFNFENHQTLLKLLKLLYKLFSGSIKWEALYGMYKKETVILLEYIRLVSSGRTITSEEFNDAIGNSLWK